ncbi:MAG: glucan biosynthesis protein [Gemmobacter sp.]
MRDVDRYRPFPPPTRRATLLTAAAAAVVAVLPGRSAGDGRRFDLDALAARMRQLARQPPLPAAGGWGAELGYDDWRRIRFRGDRTRWQVGPAAGGFGLQAFHPGWLFGDPVRLWDISEGAPRAMAFSAADFEGAPLGTGGLPADLPADLPPDLPGVAGFRLLWPLNRAGVQDELAAFLGASYFRALGAGSAYGLSARGLAINTAVGRPEEFPRFTDFYFRRPAPGDRSLTVLAALEGPSVTGAYAFDLRPGRTTRIDVTARLFFRADVEELGIAPLTSMFLYDAKNRAAFDDFRPRVHDSEGLAMLRRDGTPLWRPLNNPARVASSYFADPVARFGLHQRDRDFASYQDAEARYHRRPSVDVEPLGDWGPGMVRLVELPTALEAEDNIVAFFVPGDGRVAAGEARDYRWRLRWGDLDEGAEGGLARVAATRAGQGGVSGVLPSPGLRKFVVDFEGVDPAAGAPRAVVTCAGGKVQGQVLTALPGGGGWRLVLDVRAAPGAVVEMTAHLAGAGRRLSETWVYQWDAAR